MKNNLLVAAIIILVLVGAGGFWYTSSRNTVTETESTTLADGERVMQPEEEETPGKLKADVFSGKLETVNEGCYYDAECFLVVDGKHVTVLRGWSQETVGSVVEVESFGDFKNHIGATVEVYAQDKGDGTYTLYGSEGFYAKLVK